MISKRFNQTLKKKPYALQKGSANAIISVRTTMRRFNDICSMTLEQELAKYSKKEAEQLRKEMKENHEK